MAKYLWSISASTATSCRMVAKWFPSMYRSYHYGNGFAICRRPVCALKHHFVTHFTKFTSTIQAFVVSSLISLLSVELHNHQKIQLQHFDLFFAGPATAVVILLTSCQLAEKQFYFERHILICMLSLSVIYRQRSHLLVTDRSQQIASLSRYLRLTVSDKLPINCWQVAIPITDWSVSVP